MLTRMPVEAGRLTLLVLIAVVWCGSTAQAQTTPGRSEEHQQFSEEFWVYMEDRYGGWKQLETFPDRAPQPEAGTEGTIYANDVAARDTAQFAYGSILVIEHQRDGKPYALSVLFRAHPGVNKKRDDWYELVYLIDGTTVKTSADQSTYDRPGFVTKLVDGRLWVLALDSPDVGRLIQGEGPEKHVTLPGAGPDRKTLKTDSRETAMHYLFSKPGFVTHFEDGRAWVFAQGTEGAAKFAKDGPPEKHVTRIGAGPMRTTIKAPDAETIDQFLGKSDQ